MFIIILLDLQKTTCIRINIYCIISVDYYFFQNTVSYTPKGQRHKAPVCHLSICICVLYRHSVKMCLAVGFSCLCLPLLVPLLYPSGNTLGWNCVVLCICAVWASLVLGVYCSFLCLSFVNLVKVLPWLVQDNILSSQHFTCRWRHSWVLM